MLDKTILDKAILDNILVAFESLHHLKTKKTGKNGFMAIKLDMSKAYERLEWCFLMNIMERMGFHEKWRGLIYVCISSVSFSVMVNGEPRGHIVPTRGLRQADPLSPYLFLLCSEGLRQADPLIQHAINDGKLYGFSLYRSGPKISHLFLQMIVFSFVVQEWRR